MLFGSKRPSKHISFSGLEKSLARHPGAIVFSSRATKMYYCPARRATLNTGLPRVLKTLNLLV